MVLQGHEGDCHADKSPSWSELERIGHYVAEDLTDFMFIDFDQSGLERLHLGQVMVVRRVEDQANAGMTSL